MKIKTYALLAAAAVLLSPLLRAAEEDPTAPIKTLVRDRFIARHMTTVRIVPALPTNTPPMSITLL